MAKSYRKPRHKHGRTPKYPRLKPSDDRYWGAPISRAVRSDSRQLMLFPEPPTVPARGQIVIDPLLDIRCLGWKPVRRANPNSSLRGYAAFEMPSGLIFNEVTVCSSGRVHWVQLPARLRMDINYVPHGVGANAIWEILIEFRDGETRRRFSRDCIRALLESNPAHSIRLQPPH